MEEPEWYQSDSVSRIKEGKAYFSRIGWLYFLGTLIMFVVQILFSYMMSQMNLRWFQNTGMFLFVNMLPMYVLSLPLMIAIVSCMRVEKAVKTCKMSVGQMVQAMLISLAILYVSNLAGTLLTTGIELFKGSSVQNALEDLLASENSWSVFIATVIMAPIYEEFIFRKLLIDRAVRYGEGVSVLLSGLLFGLFHGNISQLVYAFPLGAFFGFIYVKTRRLRYTVILHMLVNFMGSMVSLWVLEKVNLQELQMFMSNPPAGEGLPESLVIGMMIMLVYYVVLMAVVIGGIILLLVHRGKFKLSQGSFTIPEGGRFRAVIVNPGMLLFLGFWTIQIVLQLFG